MTSEPAEVTEGTDEEETDPYQAVCAAFQPGLLILVNDSDPSQAGFSEMEVSYVDEGTGEVTLTDGPETMYEISFDDPYFQEYDGPVIREMSSPNTRGRVEKVTTIEIVGIK